ncbi:MAG: NAD(P)/FAD-dependent oxidoreductase [Sphingomonadales bacterium]|nr:NAD(P)/FAD-dependent oxidoreductase [Sphingomonadales bacterium]
MIDCLIVGGGPAGLTAAIYLARFHLEVLVVDGGNSRAMLIPKTRNHAGFPEGITGPNLLRRMSQQARIYGARVAEGSVDALVPEGGGFQAMGGFGAVAARTVLLATGVINNRPDMPDALHDEALARGLLRYCPICDGYEVTDQPVGVIGTGGHGMREALFLRGYSADVTLIAPGAGHELGAAERAALAEAGVRLVDGPTGAFELGGDRVRMDSGAGVLAFAAIYPALGSAVRSELGVALGAETSAEGCLLVDAHQRTSVTGLYAAGDVVKGLDQISHAMGEGGVAATTMRNDLAERRRLLR